MTGFTYRQYGYERREETEIMPRFLARAAGKMELPFTETKALFEKSRFGENEDFYFCQV